MRSHVCICHTNIIIVYLNKLWHILFFPTAYDNAGRYDSSYHANLGQMGSVNSRKFLAVREGGTLELHGKKKTSWTRLAQTIPSQNDLPCAIIYDHADQDVS